MFYSIFMFYMLRCIFIMAMMFLHVISIKVYVQVGLQCSQNNDILLLCTVYLLYTLQHTISTTCRF